jgi:hypothetical protein
MRLFDLQVAKRSDFSFIRHTGEGPVLSGEMFSGVEKVVAASVSGINGVAVRLSNSKKTPLPTLSLKGRGGKTNHLSP